MKRLILIIATASLLFASCGSEKALDPTTEPEPVAGPNDIPQGDNSFDQTIVDLYDKYNSVILYRFADKEFWWNINSDLRWKWNATLNSTYAGYEYKPAEEDHVGDLIALMEDKFMKFYPDSFLAHYLPRKILLVGDLRYVAMIDNEPTESDKQERNIMMGTFHMAVNGANSGTATMSAEERNKFKNDVSCAFIDFCRSKEYIKIAQDFQDLSEEFSSKAPANEQEANKYGYLNKTSHSSAVNDWQDYISLITSTSYAELTAATGPNNCLHSSRDVNGRIRKKYNAIIIYFFKNFNIDLQDIGNDA